MIPIPEMAEDDNSGFVEVGRVSGLAIGAILPVAVGERRIVLCRNENGIYAADDRCPHRGGPLSEGDVMGTEIVCPWHLWGFDLETGCTPIDSDVSLRMHEVLIEGDRILVHLSQRTTSD